MQANINLESLYNDKVFQIKINRDLFEHLFKNKFIDLISFIQHVLKLLNFEKDEIEETIIIEGSI